MYPIAYLVSLVAKRALVPLQLKFQAVKRLHVRALQEHQVL